MKEESGEEGDALHGAVLNDSHSAPDESLDEVWGGDECAGVVDWE